LVQIESILNNIFLLFDLECGQSFNEQNLRIVGGIEAVSIFEYFDLKKFVTKNNDFGCFK
jgi:hypothetical protein